MTIIIHVTYIVYINYSLLGVVVGVSDFLMTTLAKGTVAVGKKVGTVISESDVSL